MSWLYFRQESLFLSLNEKWLRWNLFTRLFIIPPCHHSPLPSHPWIRTSSKAHSSSLTSLTLFFPHAVRLGGKSGKIGGKFMYISNGIQLSWFPIFWVVENSSSWKNFISFLLLFFLLLEWKTIFVLKNGKVMECKRGKKREVSYGTKLTAAVNFMLQILLWVKIFPGRNLTWNFQRISQLWLQFLVKVLE